MFNKGMYILKDLELQGKMKWQINNGGISKCILLGVGNCRS